MTVRRRLPHVAAALLFALLALAAQRGLVRAAGTGVYAQELAGNDSLLHVWTLAWDHHALRTDPLGIIDANIFFPQRGTLLYSDHLIGLAVLLAPLRLVTANPVVIHNAALLAAPALDALAMYALVFGLVGRAAPALVAGLLYGFAPFRLGADRTQIQMLAAWWLPLLLHWGRRAVVDGRRRDALAAGVALALQGLTGIYLTAFFAPFLALAHLWWLRCWPWRTHRTGWRRLLVAEAVAVAVLLPSAIAYRVVQRDLGAVRSIVLNALLSVPIQGIGQFLPLASLGAGLLAAVAARRWAPPAARRELPLLLAIVVGGVLFAAGPAIELPHGWGTVRGPYAALVPLPGYNALRAPGRMLHVAMVGWAAVAGIGFAAATARLGPRGRGAALLAALGVIAWECVPPAYPLMGVPTRGFVPPVYRWLATQPDDVRVAELPLGTALLVEQLYQYESTAHWKPILNGSMGIVPPMHPYMTARLAPPVDRDVLAELGALGITHLVLHEEGMPPAQVAALAQATQGPHAPLKLRARFPRTTVLALRPGLRLAPTAPPAPALARTAWHASASVNRVDAAAAIDDDPQSAWRAWGVLERRLRTRWYDRTSFVERWRRFLAAQPARLAVDLGGVHPLLGVGVDLGGSDPLAPPLVTVETSLDGVTWTAQPGLLRPMPDVRALVADAADARWLLAFPAATPARWLRLSCVGLDWQVRDLVAY